MPIDRKNTSSSIVGFFRSLYLTNRFFYLMCACAIGFILCYIFRVPNFFMIVASFVAIGIVFLDLVTIYRLKNGILAYRDCPDRLSNGDHNKILIYAVNKYPMKMKMKIVEEVPFQFQKRDLLHQTPFVDSEKEVIYSYELRPTQRGVYLMGAVNIFVSSIFGLIERRYLFDFQKQVAVYPSFLEMNKYELLAASNRLTELGIKKIRRRGQASEFDNIKQYVTGDDPRTINYKATARANQLMVNTYQEERSQPVYCLVDKGRTMQMPFLGMTLLDYAINSTLMVASTALNKGDKAGLITFSKDIDEILMADKRQGQKNKILETLYKQKTNFAESDYEKLYAIVRRKLTQRSLIILYTNFETVNGMRRQLKFLTRLAKDHLVLVSFFLNSEFDEVLSETPKDVGGIFAKGVAEKLSYDKELIVRELNRYGIQTVLSRPEHLTIDSINKYLEFKTKGLI